MIRKKLAFTLAEVLIVIGIIGVVAALTLPNLNHATGDKETVTKVKKVYSALSEAYGRAEAIYGPIDEWFKANDDDVFDDYSEKTAKRITEFMKVSKDCGFEAGCFSNAPFKYIDGADRENYLEYLQDRNAYMVTLSDGCSLAFENFESAWFVQIRVDIDGPNKGNNMLGKDLFNFLIGTSEADCLYYDNQVCIYNTVTPDSGTGRLQYNFIGNYPSYWIIENGNLDYLKADEGENGDLTCPNGKTLNWTTNTSCN